MVTPELVSYIKTQQAQGITQAEITTALIAQGWGEEDINRAFAESASAQPLSSPQSTDADIEVQMLPEKPRGIFDFKNMKWYEWFALLPVFFLLVQGGAVGAAIGAFGWSYSLKIMRNNSYSRTAKIGMVIGITIGYYVAYVIIASVLIGIIRGLFEK